MDKKQIVLAALASADGYSFTPVKVQKLFFILDRQIPTAIGGPHFNFQPYDYGPFDKAVYDVLNELQNEGLVEIVYENPSNLRRYKLTPTGQEQGQGLLSSLPADSSDYIRRVSDFVKRQSFTGLVTAIYRAFPDMKINSIFR